MSQSDPGGSDADPFGVTVPAEIAKQLQLVSYIFVGTTAVLLWDVLNNLSEEYTILFKRKLRLSVGPYLMSRISSLVYVIGFTVFTTYPIGACKQALTAFDCFLPLATSSSALLFYFRLRAVYGGARLVSLLFLFLWLCVTGTSLTIPIGSAGATIGNTQACVVTKVSRYIAALGVTQCVYSTGIFLAISGRLLADAPVRHSTGQKAWAVASFGRPNLHAYSRTLFMDGQKYYIISVLVNLVVLIMVFAPVSPVYQGMLGGPAVGLTSIMACRVYRHARLHRWSAPAELDTLPLPVISESRREPDIDMDVVVSTSSAQDSRLKDPASGSVSTHR
ncbi:hypothetical protein C8F01DRAFT_1012932 [Mycena amicta]|nr:hypothetical protein C8F01DRAFT_1012932 [Mycena amicta]